MDRSDRARRISAILAETYPDAECELDYRTPWELLVATVLSAQCTDERVNRVTPELFRRWPGPSDLAQSPLPELEETVRSTGFFRAKARNLREAARAVAAEHGGELPRSLDALTVLPGVGRKTAKVVLGEGFGIAAGIAVDTHVHRLARRMGLADHRDPEKVAAALEELLPREEWVRFSMRMILHGRRVCTARRPACPSCPIGPVCPQVGL